MTSMTARTIRLNPRTARTIRLNPRTARTIRLKPRTARQLWNLGRGERKLNEIRYTLLYKKATGLRNWGSGFSF